MVRVLLVMLLMAAAGQARSAVDDTLQQLSSATLMERGRQYFEQRQAAKALACFLTVSRRTQDSAQVRIRALNNAACVYKYLDRDNLKAYDYLTRAYRLCDSIHYDEFMPVIMVNMGDLINDNNANSQSAGMSKEAHDIFDQCMRRAVVTRNWELMTTAFFNLSNQNYSLPLERYELLFSSEIPDSTPDLHYARLQYRALEHLQQRQYAEARNCFEQQLACISARWEPVRDSIASYASIAHTYHEEGDYGHAISYLERALEVAEQSDVADQADYIRQKLTAAQAQLLDNRQRLQQYVILGVGIVLLIVIGMAYLLWRKNRELWQRNKSLYRKNLQLLDVERRAHQLQRDYEQQLTKQSAPQQQQPVVDTKYNRSNLNDERRETLAYRIGEILDDPATICQQDFTLAKLAKMADTNTTYASQVINEKYGMAFSNVLAGLRIKEACRRISDEREQYSQLTIEAIGGSVGFKSRTAFINAFKREVGLTPSEYLRMAAGK